MYRLAVRKNFETHKSELRLYPRESILVCKFAPVTTEPVSIFDRCRSRLRDKDRRARSRYIRMTTMRTTTRSTATRSNVEKTTRRVIVVDVTGGKSPTSLCLNKRQRQRWPRGPSGEEAEWEIPGCDRDKMQRRCRLTKGRRNAYSDRTYNRLRGRPY